MPVAIPAAVFRRGQKTMRLPIAESMESRIFTRAGAYFIKCGGLAVSAYEERERERERERVAKILEWPNVSVIFFAPLVLFNSRLIRISSKFAAKIRNNLRINSIPLEKLTNRHEKGRERLFPHFAAGVKSFFFSHSRTGRS